MQPFQGLLGVKVILEKVGTPLEEKFVFLGVAKAWTVAKLGCCTLRG